MGGGQCLRSFGGAGGERVAQAWQHGTRTRPCMPFIICSISADGGAPVAAVPSCRASVSTSCMATRRSCSSLISAPSSSSSSCCCSSSSCSCPVPCSCPCPSSSSSSCWLLSPTSSSCVSVPIPCVEATAAAAAPVCSIALSDTSWFSCSCARSSCSFRARSSAMVRCCSARWACRAAAAASSDGSAAAASSRSSPPQCSGGGVVIAPLPACVRRRGRVAGPSPVASRLRVFKCGAEVGSAMLAVASAARHHKAATGAAIAIRPASQTMSAGETG